MADELFDQVQKRIKAGESKESIADELALSIEEVRFLSDVETYQAVVRALSRPPSEYRPRPRRAVKDEDTEQS